MKKILLPFLVLLPLISYAQDTTTYKAVCGDTNRFFSGLSREYGEQPILGGTGNDNQQGVMTLWVNPNTLTWTIVITHEAKTCVVGSGKGFTVRQPDKPESKNVPDILNGTKRF